MLSVEVVVVCWEDGEDRGDESMFMFLRDRCNSGWNETSQLVESDRVIVRNPRVFPWRRVLA